MGKGDGAKDNSSRVECLGRLTGLTDRPIILRLHFALGAMYVRQKVNLPRVMLIDTSVFSTIFLNSSKLIFPSLS